jgi:hypothetical protein
MFSRSVHSPALDPALRLDRRGSREVSHPLDIAAVRASEIPAGANFARRVGQNRVVQMQLLRSSVKVCPPAQNTSTPEAGGPV